MKKKNNYLAYFFIFGLIFLILPIINAELVASPPAECTIGRVWCSFNEGLSVIKECPSGQPTIKEKCTENEICDVNDEGIPFCRIIETNNEIIGDPTAIYFYVVILLLIVLIILILIKKKK